MNNNRKWLMVKYFNIDNNNKNTITQNVFEWFFFGEGGKCEHCYKAGNTAKRRTIFEVSLKQRLEKWMTTTLRQRFKSWWNQHQPLTAMNGPYHDVSNRINCTITNCTSRRLWPNKSNINNIVIQLVTFIHSNHCCCYY